MSRWRGTIDVPLIERGEDQAHYLLDAGLDLDAIYHDGLQRCEHTASVLDPRVLFENKGPRPWNMGHLFEGREITEDSLELARHYINEPYAKPPGGETFANWSDKWLWWLTHLHHGFSATGIVTHNRNIQYLYSLHEGKFHYKMYDCVGPDFCSVHVYDQHSGAIAPWGYANIPNGIYLIRHGETEFGT